MEPSPTSRFRCRKTIASQGVLELLWDRHLKDSVAEVHHLYSALKGSSVTTNAAGGIIELRMHWLLRQGCFFDLFSFGHNRTTQKFDVYGNYTSKEEESLECPGLFGIFEGDWLDEGVQPQVNRYYRLKVNSFLKINSLLLIHPRIEPLPTLFMFRFTGEEECDVKDADLEKIERLKFFSDARRYYVVVTPVGIHPPIGVPGRRFANVGVLHKSIGEDWLFPPT